MLKTVRLLFFIPLTLLCLQLREQNKMSDRLLEAVNLMWDLYNAKTLEAADVPVAFLRCNQSRLSLFLSAVNAGSLFRWTSHPTITYSLSVEHDQNEEGPDLNM